MTVRSKVRIQPSTSRHQKKNGAKKAANGTANIEKLKQLLKYKKYLLLRDVWCSKF